MSHDTFVSVRRTMLLAAMALLAGCSTIHTDSGETVGMWIVSQPEQRRLARDVLADHGVQAALDDTGIAVKTEDATKASMILLTDQRLKDSGLMLMVFARAGTGHVTDQGMVAVLEMAPNEADASMDR